MPSKPLATRLREKRNHPPPDEPWIWLTREMLESDAWRTLSIVGRRILERLMLEHMAHRGTENGKLIATYDDLEKWGIRRKSIRGGIAEVTGRGLVVVTEEGKRSCGTDRMPARYALGWLPTADGAAAPNRWRTWQAPQAEGPSRGRIAPRNGAKPRP